MPYLVSYDIEDDKHRLKTANRLLASGCVRLQKSVFAGQLDDTVYKTLVRWLQNQPRGPDDSIFILNIGPESLRSTLWLGKEAPEWEIATGPPDVLFI